MARPEKISPGLGERLKFLRKDKTRAEFSAEIGIHENTLGGYERGERQPDFAFFTQLRESTGVNLNWLATGAGQPYDAATSTLRHDNPTSAIIAQVGSIDGELFQEVLKLVRRVYQAENVSLPADAISTATVQYYNALMALPAAPQDTEDLLLLLPWLEKQVRKDIRNAASELGTGKHSA